VVGVNLHGCNFLLVDFGVLAVKKLVGDMHESLEDLDYVVVLDILW